MTDRHRGDGCDRLVADKDMAGRGVQACPCALGAGLTAHEFRQFLAHHAGVSFPVAAFEVGQNSFKGMLAADACTVAGQVAELDDFLTTAVEQDVLDGKTSPFLAADTLMSRITGKDHQ